jgi:hypothetical protein
MPKFDGTGPMGMGPRTGRGFGPCGFGLGLRRMFGRGRGMGRYFGWNQPQTPKDQLAALDDYKKALEKELEDINKEKKELSKEK